MDLVNVIIFSKDRPASDVFPWYHERKQRCLELIWRHAHQLLEADTDVVLELGLIQRQGRMAFCARARDQGFSLRVHVLDAPREQRRERVRRRNVEQGVTFSMVVPDAIFEMASDLWQAPDEFECAELDVVFIPSAPG